MPSGAYAAAVLDDLVRAARADRPSRGAVRRAVVALGVGVAATATASAAAGASVTAVGTTTTAAGTTATVVAGGKSAAMGLSVLSIAKAATVGLAVGAVVIGTATYTGMLAHGPGAPAESAGVAPAVAMHVRALSPRSAGPAADRGEAVDPVDESMDQNGAVGAPPSARGAIRPAAAPAGDEAETAVGRTEAPSGETALAEEVRLLEAARSEIAAGRAGAGLDALDRYRRDYPDGRLALEADVLRIEALFRAGRAATAIGLANKFLAAHSNSPLANRVRALLRDPPGAAR
jgi:hypothetical protein